MLICIVLYFFLVHHEHVLYCLRFGDKGFGRSGGEAGSLYHFHFFLYLILFLREDIITLCIYILFYLFFTIHVFHCSAPHLHFVLFDI